MSKSLGKRILAITLSVLMVMTLLPTGMFADDNGETTATVVATQTDSGTLTILSGADFTDETLYLYVNYEYTGDLDSDYINYEPGYLCDSSWTNVTPLSSYNSCGGTYVISLVELAEIFTTAGYDVANGVVLNYWGQDYSSFTSAQLVSTASSSGETGGEETEATDTSSWVVVLQGFDTEYSGWAYTTLSDAGVLSYSVPLQTILDANNLDLAGLGGVQFSVNGLTLTEDRSAGISDGVTLYYRVYINDELYVSSSSEIVTDTTWSSYTFLTLNYEANFGWDDYYNYSADDVLYAEVSLTAFDDEDEPTVVALPWVDEAVAENTLTLSGQQWWYGIIYCTEAYDGEAGTYDAGVSSDLDGFLKAIACDDAVIEIVSTGSGIDQIFLQKASDYSGTDSLNMTVTDNGDGTYTSTISGAELSAYADAVVEEGDSVWKVLVNKTTDCDTVITSISVYVPSSTSLPWVDEPLAENTYTISGQAWWRQLIICSESASEETYDNYVSTDMEGFLAAIAEDDAVLEITSTGSGVDQIFFQYKVSDDVYEATDAISLTITDNGDGTYTSSVSGANLNALVTAFEAEGCSAWKLYINKTTDCETVITSMQVVEGSVVVDEEFDLSSYTLWSTEEVNVTSGIWNSYSFTDGSWADALAYDGAILVITRDSTDYSSGYDNFFFQDSSNWSSLGLGSGTSSADISCAFDNGEMVVYTGSTVYNALASRGMSPDVFVSNSDADPTYTITSVSVYIPTATILAANQELIDYLSSLMDTDEVIYINQTDADEGYDESGYLNYFLYVYNNRLSPNMEEITENWWTSLGDEASIRNSWDNDSYVAPIAGTEDDPDGTDGSFTYVRSASVGEGDTYVESDVYYTTVVIKATQLYHVDTPSDPDGRFTVTTSADYATEGEEITITIETASGYKVSTFTVWYQDENGDILSLGTNDQGNGVWTITMPAYDIWMEVTVGTLDVNYVYDSDAVYLVDGVGSANEGEEVTFYVFVNRGYELDGEITAVDENGDAVTLTEVYSGLSIMNYKPSTAYAYSFTMPDSSVTITATSFKAIDGFVDGAFYITDYGEISFIDQVDFTDSDTYLVISYDLMFESDENVDNYGDWSPGAIYAVSDTGEWIQIFSIPSYYSTNGTYAIALTDIAALASDAGCNIDDYGVIINWWVGDDEYASNETFTLVSADYTVNTEVVGWTVSDSTVNVNVEGVPSEGNTITVSVYTTGRYIVGSVTATDASGNEIALTRDYMGYSAGRYTFTMPASDVTITVDMTSQDLLSNIVTETATNSCVDSTYGSPIFYSKYVDFTDPDQYLVLNYSANEGTDGTTVACISYGYEYISGYAYSDIVRLVDTGSGCVAIALTDIQEAIDASGITEGVICLYVYSGEFTVNSVEIKTMSSYTADASSVGDVVTIGNVDYEITWDTTTPNPISYQHQYSSALGWSTTLYTGWWDVYVSFREAVVSHLSDSSLVQVVTEDEITYNLGVWLQLVTDYHIVYCGITYNDNTAYFSLDDFAETAANDGYTITAEEISSLVIGDVQESTSAGITAVRILTPLTYEVDSTTWTVDMTSATLKLVAGSHVVYVDSTDVISEVTGATCTTDGQVVYTATAAYNGQVFEVSTTATIPATGHTESAAVEENRVEATCTTDGSYDSVVYCSVCGEELSRETVTIPATGHSYVTVVTDPTCEEEGYTTYTCSVCGATYDDDYVAATGHSYGEPEWTWDGYTSATAKFTCENDSDHVVEVEAIITPDTTPATCESDGETVYTASIIFDGTEYTSTETEVLTATGHDWSVEYTWSEDGKTCTATHVCANDAEHNVSETVTTSGVQSVAPTCTEKGTTTYTATFTSSWAETKTMDVVDIDALGHTEAEAVEENRVEPTCTADGSYDSVVYCSVCGEELSRETVTIPATGHTEAEAVEENRVEPTCTADGSYDSVVYCSVCGEELSRETVTISAIGHNYGEPVWTWTGYTSATATFTCGNDSTHVEVVTAEIKSDTTPATCEEDGETIYTATVTFEGTEYTSIEIEVLTAIGHNWSVSYEWTEDGKTCTATRSCANDSAHDVSETVTTSGTVTVEPTCTEMGTTTYTATFTADWAETKTMDVQDVAALGHEWTVEYTWSTDGKTCTATHICGRDSTHNESETVTTTGTVTVEPTCTEKGTTTYTATFTSDWADTKTMDVADIDANGHTYGEPTFTWNTETCKATATFNCTVDGCDGSYTTEADVTSDTTPAACTVDGKTVYTAVVTFNETEYTDTYEVVIPATGHTTEIQNAKDATCTEDGYTGDEVCTVCGETITQGTVISAAHSFGEDGVCTVCGAKKDESSSTPTVTVESGDTIFASVLPSGLVTEVEITLSVDGGTVIVSTVTEDDSNPHLVDHIADALEFTLFNESQGDDLVKDTNSFTITTTENNKETLKKVTILFYGDIDYDGTSAPVTMSFATSSSLRTSDIYVLHYTGVGTVWEVVSSTSSATGKQLTVDFNATSFSPYVVVAVSNASAASDGSTIIDILMRISADYTAVNDAIATANALDPADYVDFSAVTAAINSVDWTVNALNQATVDAYALAINNAIDSLVKVTTEESVDVVEPIEGTDTDTEADETEPEPAPEASEEQNPTTGIALSLIPMAIAALAAVATKRK